MWSQVRGAGASDRQHGKHLTAKRRGKLRDAVSQQEAQGQNDPDCRSHLQIGYECLEKFTEKSILILPKVEAAAQQRRRRRAHRDHRQAAHQPAQAQ